MFVTSFTRATRLSLYEVLTWTPRSLVEEEEKLKWLQVSTFLSLFSYYNILLSLPDFFSSFLYMISIQKLFSFHCFSFIQIANSLFKNPKFSWFLCFNYIPNWVKFLTLCLGCGGLFCCSISSTPLFGFWERWGREEEVSFWSLGFVFFRLKRFLSDLVDKNVIRFDK